MMRSKLQGLSLILEGENHPANPQRISHMALEWVYVLLVAFS